MTNGTRQSGPVPTHQIDELIDEQFAKSNERDERGETIASVSVSDKLTWANRTNVELDEIEKRLAAVCEEVPLDDPHAVARRYRKRTKMA